MVDEFLALYETHVLSPLVELDKEIKGAAAAERAAARGRGSEGSGDGDRLMLRSDAASEDAGATSGAGGNDPLEMVKQMGSQEYSTWSPGARCRALAWLCDEALSAATINDLVKKVLEAREVVDRKDREVRGSGRWDGMGWGEVGGLGGGKV